MSNIINTIFSKEEVNTGRQFEFDFAKVVCILGMVFVHCFEELGSTIEETSTAYYLVVIVLDALFGAGVFMFSMGLGVGYSYKNNPDSYIKRGIKLFGMAYVLNFLRDTIPSLIVIPLGYEINFSEIVEYLICLDILQFAGLALMLFGLLKKLKLSDKLIALVAIVMSIIGSFVRMVDCQSMPIYYSLGLLFGTVSEVAFEEVPFPLFNWFIIVVVGYLYSNLLKRVKNKNKYYMIVLPITGIILAIYMGIAIPNRLGMMCGDINYYYFFTTPNVIILGSAAIFASAAYYFISMVLSEKIKNLITIISRNINRVYCAHWIIIGFTIYITETLGIEFNDIGMLIYGISVFVVSSLLGRAIEKMKQKKEIAYEH